ncbi:MAG TPA: FAD-binding oxidoreductase [Alphaproteobacteria bacterium]|nr:FAD-binding oxidoreductase [Alphaproteobacteria bacterium]
MKLSGWGRYPVVETTLREFGGPAAAAQILSQNDEMIARGNGRSYGDAALSDALVASALPCDRLLAFDRANGVIACEAGVTLADLINFLAGSGWFPAVVPGTKFVTIGGMIAADVHGKNHHVAGSFGHFVDEIELMLADGAVLRCSREAHADLFTATLGGMGLTGIILSARFRLARVESEWIRQETLVMPDLDALMDGFEAARASTYAVAWIDSFATGDALGRGLLYLGEHAGQDNLPPRLAGRRPAKSRRRRVPFDFPSWWLNRLSMRAFNAAIYANGRRKAGTAFVALDKFFFPLDSILEWNRIYGRRGFCQYQCVLPLSASRDGMRRLLARIAASNASSFLSVLKLLGPGRGMLSFPMAGYTLALDFPRSDRTLALMDELDAITADCGGRVYLAKDARLSAAHLAAGYPELDAFRAARAAAGAAGKFHSRLSRRLEI